MPPIASRLLRAGPRLAAALLVALPTGGCGQKLLNALVPDGGYRLERDLAYGELPRQRLDVYVPDGLAGPAPVVVFFYGGRWEVGNKGDFRFVGQALAARGLIAVIPDYRRYPEVRFPAFVADGAAAVAWVRDNIAGLGGDPGSLHLMGHSAGAHIAALLALDHRYLAAAGVDRDASAASSASPDRTTSCRSTIRRSRRSSRPTTWRRPSRSPSPTAPRRRRCSSTASDDETVLPANSERLATALAAAGNRAALELYPGLGHIGLVAALAAPLRWLAPVLDDVTAFLREEHRSGKAKTAARQ